MTRDTENLILGCMVKQAFMGGAPPPVVQLQQQMMQMQGGMPRMTGSAYEMSHYRPRRPNLLRSMMNTGRSATGLMHQIGRLMNTPMSGGQIIPSAPRIPSLQEMGVGAWLQDPLIMQRILMGL